MPHNPGLLRVVVLTTLAMVAFAANSLFCRMALVETSLDAGSFSAIRLISGAAMLWLIVQLQNRKNGLVPRGKGSWLSALALFTYVAAFSFAYIKLTTATGALLLFGMVQATMIGYGFWKGERLHGWQLLGFIVAVLGLVGLLLPGLAAPPLFSSMLMLLAGVAWGVYSLRGKGVVDATGVTAGNFLRAVPMTVVLSLVMLAEMDLDPAGVAYAVASGALASGAGYAIWYTALPALQSTQAATVQLSVPVIAALAGALFLEEAITLRLVLASLAILGGIALVIWVRDK